MENAVLRSAAKKFSIAVAAAAADVGGGGCADDDNVDGGRGLKRLLLGEFDLNSSSLSNRLRAVAPSGLSVQKGI